MFHGLTVLLLRTLRPAELHSGRSKIQDSAFMSAIKMSKFHIGMNNRPPDSQLGEEALLHPRWVLEQPQGPDRNSSPRGSLSREASAKSPGRGREFPKRAAGPGRDRTEPDAKWSP